MFRMLSHFFRISNLCYHAIKWEILYYICMLDFFDYMCSCYYVIIIFPVLSHAGHVQCLSLVYYKCVLIFSM